MDASRAGEPMARRRPVPLVDDDSRVYWEGARRHELLILRCRACGFYVHYPRRPCPRCGSGEMEPARLSGRGVIHSYTVTHHPGAPGFEQAIPFAVVLVELEEQVGLRLIANVVNAPPGDVRIGLPVEIVFEDVTPDLTLPQVRIVGTPTS
jgi:uncharacterized OB-fold protein